MARLHLLLLFLGALALAGGCADKENETGAVAATGETAKAKDGQAKGGKGGGEGGGRRGGGSGRGGAAQAVEATNLIRRDLSEVLPVVGSIAANEVATIKPEMNGLIHSIHFEEGQKVKKGELLVQLEDSELQAQLAQGQARFNLAKLNLERADNLRQTQSNTQADVDRARSEFAAAEADVALLKVRRERTQIKAPFDGVVQARALSPGDYVNTQAILTTLSDLSRLKIEFQVPERYASKVKVGTPFTVKSSMLESQAPVQGEVYFVSAVSDRATRSSQIKGYLASPPPGLKAGMFAMVEIVLEVRKGALTAPEGAILVDQRGPQLILVKDQGGDKVAAFMPVTLGLRSRGLVEVAAVKGQLSDKDVVVAAGVGGLALFPGAKLEPRPMRAELKPAENE